MPKFFKKEKKTEEETPAKVEKPFRAEEPAAEDWMHETKTNAKKKVSDKDKKASLIEKETESTARIQSLEEENKTLQSHVDELEQNFNRILDLQNEVQSLKSLLDERDSLHDELVCILTMIDIFFLDSFNLAQLL
jgi:predicted nuclease with TOPRIM domain